MYPVKPCHFATLRGSYNKHSSAAAISDNSLADSTLVRPQDEKDVLGYCQESHVQELQDTDRGIRRLVHKCQ